MILHHHFCLIDIVSLPVLERIETAEKIEKPVGAKLESHLVKEIGYSGDSTAKPIARKKKNTRKGRHGESTKSRYSSDS